MVIHASSAVIGLVLLTAVVYMLWAQAVRHLGGDEARGPEKLVIVPLSLLLVVLSWMTNMTVGMVLEGALPRSWDETFTERVERVANEDEGWRRRVARGIARFLNWHDPDHVILIEDE